MVRAQTHNRSFWLRGSKPFICGLVLEMAELVHSVAIAGDTLYLLVSMCSSSSSSICSNDGSDDDDHHRLVHEVERNS